MIVGIGHDVVEIGRVARIMEGTAAERFRRRVLTDAECEAARARGNSAEFVAGRFAAKEAVVKALGCGIGQAVGFRDIEIMPDAAGKPHCVLSADAWSRLASAGGRFADGPVLLHVSISHERSIASAFAIAERC